jgi:CrcB protein
MDEPLHPDADGPDHFAREHELLEHDPDRDLLDEPVLPLFGLSVGVMLAIFLGGALGTLARYELAAHHPITAGGFPWVTLLVNLSGSLAIGLLVPLTQHASPRAPLLGPFLVIGLLGGWTTYSTLAVESTLLVKDGDVGTMVAYLVATVAGGLTLVVAGHGLGRRMVAA